MAAMSDSMVLIFVFMALSIATTSARVGSAAMLGEEFVVGAAAESGEDGGLGFAGGGAGDAAAVEDEDRVDRDTRLSRA
jgi:hypothetical protein